MEKRRFLELRFLYEKEDAEEMRLKQQIESSIMKLQQSTNSSQNDIAMMIQENHRVQITNEEKSVTLGNIDRDTIDLGKSNQSKMWDLRAQIAAIEHETSSLEQAGLNK